MFDEIRAARPEEEEAVCRFYERVCAELALDEYGPGWHWGIYPDREDLAAHVRGGALLLGFIGGCIAGAGVLAAGEDPVYAGTPWTIPTAAARVCVLHLFALRRDFRGGGRAAALLEAVLERAAAEGYTVLHLDVVSGNLPAERLYRELGFRFAEEKAVWYPDTGDIRVRLYERALTKGENRRKKE